MVGPESGLFGQVLCVPFELAIQQQLLKTTSRGLRKLGNEGDISKTNRPFAVIGRFAAKIKTLRDRFGVELPGKPASTPQCRQERLQTEAGDLSDLCQARNLLVRLNALISSSRDIEEGASFLRLSLVRRRTLCASAGSFFKILFYESAGGWTCPTSADCLPDPSETASRAANTRATPPPAIAETEVS